MHFNLGIDKRNLFFSPQKALIVEKYNYKTQISQKQKEKKKKKKRSLI